MCVHVCMYERKNDKNLNFSWLFKEKKIHGKNNCKGNDSQEMDKKTKTITKK